MKLTRQEVYEMLYNRRKKRAMYDTMRDEDKSSRIANKFAVQNTEKEFRKQFDLIDFDFLKWADSKDSGHRYSIQNFFGDVSIKITEYISEEEDLDTSYTIGTNSGESKFGCTFEDVTYYLKEIQIGRVI